MQPTLFAPINPVGLHTRDYPQPPPFHPVMIRDTIIDMSNTPVQIINHFLQHVNKQARNCRKGIIYYSIWYHALFIPIGLASLAVSIIAFLVSTDVLTESTDRKLNFTIGVLAILISFGHASINYLELDMKRNNFNQVRKMYINLKERIEYSDKAGLEKHVLIQILETEVLRVRQHIQYRLPYFLDLKNEY